MSTVGDTGVVPQRTADPGRALRCWLRDGAAILTGAGTDPATLLPTALAVFGRHLLAYQTLLWQVAADPPAGEATHFDREARTVHRDGHRPLAPHVDGCQVFGTRYHDVVLLLCARQAPAGGDTYLVDGARLVAALGADPDLHPFLWRRVIDQGHPGGGRPATVPHRAPIASRTAAGKVTVRYHDQQRLAPEEPAGRNDAALLERWHQIVAAAADAAPRVLLRPGELLCLDNFRVFHGRDPHRGHDRLLHRFGGWSDLSFGVPDTELLAAHGSPVQITTVDRACAG